LLQLCITVVNTLRSYTKQPNTTHFKQQLRILLLCTLLQVRITAVNKVRNYISYAMSLLEEKGHSSVVLKGMGKAINKTVVVGECMLPGSKKKKRGCRLCSSGYAATDTSSEKELHMPGQPFLPPRWGQWS
jgi:hypothetical protein